LIVPSRRDQIKLTDDEQRELIENERIVVVSSLGPRGWPHVMPLWYVPRDGEIWIWTYAKSQKVKNLERDPRATLLIETGVEYVELRGVQIEAEAEIIRDLDQIVDYAKEMTIRASRPGPEAGRDPLPADTGGQLGPQQARRHLLGISSPP
jgi:general stress protein 26